MNLQRTKVNLAIKDKNEDCITVYSDCGFRGESQRICGSQSRIPSHLRDMEIKSIKVSNSGLDFLRPTMTNRLLIFTASRTLTEMKSTR
jgi:hypothetical protein